MAQSPLGRTLLIANPAAHSGKGATGADFARHFLGSYATATRGYEVRLTQGPGDAVGIAAGAVGFDTVLALGGDGVIHEVVNGLMRLPESARPQLGVIPLGSGNDYARTLGMARNDVEGAFAQLVRGTVRELEVGRVNGVHFMQTLSFGLDAAIALDTTDRRAANTSQEGEALFITSGLKILSRARGGFPCTASFDDERPVDLKTLIFAVQVRRLQNLPGRRPRRRPSRRLLQRQEAAAPPPAGALRAGAERTPRAIERREPAPHPPRRARLRRGAALPGRRRTPPGHPL